MRRALAGVLLAMAALGAAAEERIADIRQGHQPVRRFGAGRQHARRRRPGTTLEHARRRRRRRAADAGGRARSQSAFQSGRPARGLSAAQRRAMGSVAAGARDARAAGTDDDARSTSASPTSRTTAAPSSLRTNRTGHYCLWSITLDGGVETQLTEESGNAAYPAVAEHGRVAYLLKRDGEWSIRVLGPDGVISVAHSSTSRLSPPTWRPGGGVLVFGEQDSAETSRLQMLVLGEPRVLKSLSGSEDLFAARAAWRSGAEFIYAADGQLWRRGIATPTREPIHLFAAAAVEVATPPTDLRCFRCTRGSHRCRHQRLGALGRWPALRLHGTRRLVARRARRAAPAD